jgi:predicted dinucleotide-binding enzyme
MNIGVLGTGSVGTAIATALVTNGHQVKMGSRSATNEKAAAWVKKSGNKASQGNFADAAAFGDLIFLCLNGAYAIEAVRSIEHQLHHKIVIDTTNPLDFTQGIPPRIIEGLSNGNSLGEEIQRAAPGAFVVKTLNTINYKLMVDAREVNNGDHHLFFSGNNADAKNKVKHFLVDNFHWKPDHLIDLGGIETARTVEAIVPFWVSVWQTMGTPLFNFKVVH